MFTKILSLFPILCIFTIFNANAAVEPDICFDKRVPISADSQGIVADYTIYFNNDQSNIQNIGTHDCAAELKEEFDPIFRNDIDVIKNIEGILLFGSADNTGTRSRNETLGKVRAATIKSFLEDNYGITVCDNENPIGRCANISIGDAIQRAINDRTSTPVTRAVYMFILYNNDQCGMYTEDILNSLSANINDNELKNKIQEAIDICNLSRKNKVLTYSQREKIMHIIRDTMPTIQNLCNSINGAEFDEDDKQCKCNEAGHIPDLGSLKCVKQTSTTINGQVYDLAELINSFKIITQDMADDASVWKTESGKFNGARLASDSIAGVVLGTAGGLITSNIVKKNQISKGFENIMCTIGGQPVATYGDEFSVGIKTK